MTVKRSPLLKQLRPYLVCLLLLNFSATWWQKVFKNTQEPVKTEGKHCAYDSSRDKLGLNVSNMLICSALQSEDHTCWGVRFHEAEGTHISVASWVMSHLRHKVRSVSWDLTEFPLCPTSRYIWLLGLGIKSQQLPRNGVSASASFGRPRFNLPPPGGWTSVAASLIMSMKDYFHSLTHSCQLKAWVSVSLRGISCGAWICKWPACL